MTTSLICPLTGERIPAEVLSRPGNRVFIKVEGELVWVDPDELTYVPERGYVRRAT